METETDKVANGHGTSVPTIKQATVKDSVKNPGGDLLSSFGKGLIYQKMVAIMKEITSVGKDQTNTVQNFKFRGIDQFINALHPLCVKHGVFVNPQNVSYDSELREVIRSNGKAGVDKHVKLLTNYVFIAEDGSSVTLGPVPSEGLDSGDKATNKALSSGLKYLLIQTFLVPTEDMVEGDSDSPEHGAPRKSSNPEKTTTPAPSSGRGGFKAPARNTGATQEKASGEADKKPEQQASSTTAPTSAKSEPQTSQPAATTQETAATGSAKTSAKTEAPATQPAETTQQSAPATSATETKPKKERARFNPPPKIKREE